MALYLSQDEIPTADAVAVAVIAAAKVTGDHPLAIGDLKAQVRARFPAVRALEIFYGQVPLSRLGRYVGIETNVHQKLLSAENAAWWSDHGRQAVEAACDALENI